MQNNIQPNNYADKLQFLGVVLFLFGLLIGLFIPILSNSRIGVSAHLEGVMNGMFLILLGFLWQKLHLSNKWLNIAYWLAVYGTFANFFAVAISAITGAGKMLPNAGGKEGAPMMECIVFVLLISLSIAMITLCIVILKGLYHRQSSSGSKF